MRSGKKSFYSKLVVQILLFIGFNFIFLKPILAFFPPPPPDSVTLASTGASSAKATWEDIGLAYYYYVMISTSDTFTDWSEDVGGVAPLSSKDFSSLAPGIYYVYVGSADYSMENSTQTRSNALTILETTAPTIDSISSAKADGTYGVDEVIDVIVTFSEAVTSTGNVTITLETGSTDRNCSFNITNAVSGSCDYTVKAGDSSADLNEISITGDISDQVGNVLTNYTPATSLADNKDIVIDTTVEEVVTSSNNSVTTVSVKDTNCRVFKPGSIPELFQLDPGSNLVKLFFTPSSNPVSGYTIEYGIDPEKSEHAISFKYGDTSGVVTYTINSLADQQTWYFKVRADNGCSTSDWSVIKSIFVGSKHKVFAKTYEAEITEPVVLEVSAPVIEPTIDPISEREVLGVSMIEPVASGFIISFCLFLWLGLLILLIILYFIWQYFRKKLQKK